jgi:hypothetical protein
MRSFHALGKAHGEDDQQYVRAGLKFFECYTLQEVGGPCGAPEPPIRRNRLRSFRNRLPGLGLNQLIQQQPCFTARLLPRSRSPAATAVFDRSINTVKDSEPVAEDLGRLAGEGECGEGEWEVRPLIPSMSVTAIYRQLTLHYVPDLRPLTGFCSALPRWDLWRVNAGGVRGADPVQEASYYPASFMGSIISPHFSPALPSGFWVLCSALPTSTILPRYVIAMREEIAHDRDRVREMGLPSKSSPSGSWFPR